MSNIIFEWKIINLFRHSSDDMIYSIEWQLDATDSPNTVSASGSVGLKPSSEFIPFIDLTQELVIDWLLAALGAEQQLEYENGLAESLSALRNPPILEGMPW